MKAILRPALVLFVLLSLLTGVAEGLKTGSAREYETLLVTLRNSLRDIENAPQR